MCTGVEWGGACGHVQIQAFRIMKEWKSQSVIIKENIYATKQWMASNTYNMCNPRSLAYYHCLLCLHTIIACFTLVFIHNSFI